MSRAIANGGARIAERRAAPLQRSMGPQAIIRTKLELLALLCVEFVDGKKRPIAMQTVEQSDIEEPAREFLDAVEANRAPRDPVLEAYRPLLQARGKR